MDTAQHELIIFDGVCPLCLRSVRFIIRHDKKKRFRFVALQHEYAQKKLRQFSLSDPGQSILLIRNHQVLSQSTAVLHIARRLRFPVNLFYAFIIIPKFLRDGVYRYISRRRYRWFGRYDQCMTPSADIRSRFQD